MSTPNFQQTQANGNKYKSESSNPCSLPYVAKLKLLNLYNKKGVPI